jgi:hypothetical protein
MLFDSRARKGKGRREAKQSKEVCGCDRLNGVVR